jgi:phage terminase small subunit
MPRKSAEALRLVPPSAPCLSPRADMDHEVKAVFKQIIASVPIEHFKPSDYPLIESYAKAIVLSQRAYAAIEEEGFIVRGKPSPAVSVWEKASKAEVALSARLRLSPQHRYQSTSSKLKGPPQSAYDILKRHRDEED